jgi:hypothetical protein
MGCTSAVYDWFLLNDLRWNGDKSKVIQMGTMPQQRKLTSMLNEVNVVGSLLIVSRQVKLLGVTFDSHLCFDTHVSNTIRACHYHSWALHHIPNMLTTDVAKAIVCSIVIS